MRLKYNLKLMLRRYLYFQTIPDWKLHINYWFGSLKKNHFILYYWIIERRVAYKLLNVAHTLIASLLSEPDGCEENPACPIGALCHFLPENNIKLFQITVTWSQDAATSCKCEPAINCLKCNYGIVCVCSCNFKGRSEVAF